jgi:hypothetical protein
MSKILDMKLLFAQVIDPNTLNIPKATNSGVIQTVLQFTFGLGAALSFLIIVFAGFQFVTSGGDSNKVKKARQTILYASIGLAVTLGATLLVSFAVGQL